MKNVINYAIKGLAAVMVTSVVGYLCYRQGHEDEFKGIKAGLFDNQLTIIDKDGNDVELKHRNYKFYPIW